MSYGYDKNEYFELKYHKFCQSTDRELFIENSIEIFHRLIRLENT